MSKIIDIGSANNKFDLSSIKRVEEIKTEEVKPEIKDDSFLDEIMNNNNFRPVPQILSSEENTRRREYILKIDRYRKQFSNCCQEWANIDLTSKSIHELENMLNDIRMTVQNQGSNNLAILAYIQCLEMVESTAPYLSMDLQGLTILCTRDEAIRNCVNEMCIEYTSTNLYPPHLRLMLLTGGIMMNLNNNNKKNKIIENYVDKKVPVELSENYKDL